MTSDSCVTIVPYFQLKAGQADAFRELSTRMIERARSEEKILYYGFSYNGDTAHCREGYADAEGLLFHLQNVGPLIEESGQYADIVRLEVHGTEEQLARLREPLKDMPVAWFTLESGFRK